MITALIILAIVAIPTLTILTVWFVFASIAEMRKVGRMSEDASHFLKTAESELTSTASDLRDVVRDAGTTLRDTDRLILTTSETIERVDHIACEAERLINAAYIAGSVAKTVKSSTAGIISVYEGVKQGIRYLRGSQRAEQGGKSHE
jgi:hypothetical protein